MLRVLKTGKPANWGAKKDEKEWAVAMEEDEFPEGFDVHFFSNVLHDWDFSDVKLLLEKFVQESKSGRSDIEPGCTYKCGQKRAFTCS